MLHVQTVKRTECSGYFAGQLLAPLCNDSAVYDFRPGVEQVFQFGRCYSTSMVTSQRCTRKHCFDVLKRFVFDELLYPVRDEEAALIVKVADIASFQPTVDREQVSRRRSVVMIAKSREILSLHLHLAFAGDASSHAS